MLKDWIKQSDLNYISKNSSQIDNTHYGSLTGYSEFMCSKLDKTYFVIKMINGVILSKNKFSNKAEAKKYIINYIKNNSTF